MSGEREYFFSGHFAQFLEITLQTQSDKQLDSQRKSMQQHRDSPTQKETTLNSNTENNIFKCPYCPATYSDEKSFMAHTRKHAGRPYACSLCDKTYTVVTALTKHMQHHTGNYKFKCSVCDKGYTSQEHYEGHMMKHQGKVRFILFLLTT